MRQLKALLLILFTTVPQLLSAQEPPRGSSWLVKESADVKVYTYMSPTSMFANTSHVIELRDQLIVVDGQFFSPYGSELKALTDKLGKKVTRFYISHDHPDHYLGFGDAFPNVPVYALPETMASIKMSGQGVLEERQKAFGPMIARNLNVPSMAQQEGRERISGVDFVFEKSVGNEAETSLVIKIPSLGIYIAQDIVYNDVHLFISGDTKGWETALRKIKADSRYGVILSGHGKEGNAALLDENLAYLRFVNESLKTTNSKQKFKAKILAGYPKYAGEMLIDIYLASYLKVDRWK